MIEMNREHWFVVIMAGGRGERFWPQSRESLPKQCLKVFSDKTLIEETFFRLERLIPKERIYIVTNQELSEQIKAVIPDAKFIVEPCAKNTAACIGLSAAKIHSLDKEAVILIETSDHVYKDVDAYIETLETALSEAEQGELVTIGIKPTRPETGFGYIRKGDKKKDAKGENVFLVKEFREKPNLEKAIEFLDSGEFLWNSGLFAFKSDKIMEEFKEHMPHLHQGLQKISQANFDEKVMSEVFQGLESISLDYGLMEKEKRIVMVEGRIPWDDIGDWAAMERLFEQDEDYNVFKGNVVSINSGNNIVFSKRLVGLVNVDNLVVVETDDAILVCEKESAQRVKELTKKLEQDEKTRKYLK
jgi:mannose-1-phosphate guanylyltransferase